MAKVQMTQRFLLLMLAAVAAFPLSAIADDRPDWRTGSAQSVQARGESDWDLTGTIVDVRDNGDGFVLRTRRGDVYVEAKGGVSAYYRGQRYRIRDLERGDRVAVDLKSSFGQTFRARSVEVIESVRRGGRYERDDRYGRDGRDGWEDRYRRDSYGHRRGNDVLEGRVVSIDARRDLMIVRTDSRRDVEVDARPLVQSHGRGWERGIRPGDRIELRGMFHGRVFVADTIGRGSSYGYDPYGRR